MVTLDYVHGYIAGLTAMLKLVKEEIDPAVYGKIKDKIKKTVNEEPGADNVL